MFVVCEMDSLGVGRGVMGLWVFTFFGGAEYLLNVIGLNLVSASSAPLGGSRLKLSSCPGTACMFPTQAQYLHPVGIKKASIAGFFY